MAYVDKRKHPTKGVTVRISVTLKSGENKDFNLTFDTEEQARNWVELKELWVKKDLLRAEEWRMREVKRLAIEGKFVCEETGIRPLFADLLRFRGEWLREQAALAASEKGE